MSNRYANLIGTNKIRDEYQKINQGFDKVQEDIDETKTDIEALDDDKVDKEVVKVLSANDYTTAEKNKLAGIEAGAEVNNISDANASELTGGAETNLHKHAADDGKVDKEVGKGLSANDYTTAEKNKLAGIEAGAEVNNISDADASELTGGAETNLHKHAAADVNITDTGGYYDSTDVEGVLQEVGSELVTHKADTMPHKFEDLKNNVTYKFGFQLSAEGNPQIIFEEVV